MTAPRPRSRQSRATFDASGLTSAARTYLQAQVALNDGDVERVVRYLSRTLRFARADVCRAMVIAATEPTR